MEKSSFRPLLVDVREVARMLGVSSRTVWTLTSDGVIPSVRVGRCRRYQLAEVERYVQSLANRSKPGPKHPVQTTEVPHYER